MADKKRCYFSRPRPFYKTSQDKKDIELLESMGYEVIDPAVRSLAISSPPEEVAIIGRMAKYKFLVKGCDVLAFRSFPDLKIGAGVLKEIVWAEESDIPVFELPTDTGGRALSVEETRKYISKMGGK